MKIFEVLNESPTDIVARFYKEAATDFDTLYNPEDDLYKRQNQKYYQNYLKDQPADVSTSVFKTPVERPSKKYSNNPDSHIESPGRRGLKSVLNRIDRQ